MYETFEHTADLGLRVRAPSFGELLEEAGRALMGVLVEDPAAETARRTESIELTADSPEDLFFDWLSELLYRFATKRFVAREFELEVTETSVRAAVRGWTFDPDRQAGGHEVKAITYHRFSVVRDAGGWAAEVILDI